MYMPFLFDRSSCSILGYLKINNICGFEMSTRIQTSVVVLIHWVVGVGWGFHLLGFILSDLHCNQVASYYICCN